MNFIILIASAARSRHSADRLINTAVPPISRSDWDRSTSSSTTLQSQMKMVLNTPKQSAKDLPTAADRARVGRHTEIATLLEQRKN